MGEQAIEQAREICLRFAREHDLTFTERGEVGFGRPCVGLLKGDSYVAFDPYDSETFEPIPALASEQFPGVLDAYHKHDCLAVLVHDDNYDAAVLQLAEWIGLMEARGPVEVREYRTGAVGLQALFSGRTAWAVVLPPPKEHQESRRSRVPLTTEGGPHE